ncbi:methyl-accepting chemotaxis protein [Roseburia sp. 499]|uniref:methyl-accepting chemotaxis protein n=1 Tax=Roseburia sp. 499 TaxID=1261634 RepID=UPI00095301FF|nr:methyl-accepting chemotaxis protein [Roseburia sp. 499]WVK69130.1 methyl-accepting chemotaxis protein [Roseburia sp. 499]
MKNVKVKTRLIGGFVVIDVVIIISLLLGYSTASNIITVDDPQHYLQNYKIFCLGALVVSLAFAGYISISLTRMIDRSVKQLSQVAHQIAVGKVNVEIEKHGNNEFGKLLDDYQKVVDNIRYQSNIAEEVANGNLTVDVISKSENDVLGNAMKKLVSRNQSALSNISDAAYQVMTSSSEVASASEALAQGSTEQASAIEQITASMDDIAEKTRTNASEANEAANLIGQTIVEVKQGNKQMQDMMVAMKDINNSSESISKIIKVIDDIAFQTNILALNAAVEAARAGEAGKGFAVVAEEVRNLAAKSAQAAAETAELIEDSIQKVGAGSKIADETAKALEAITEVVHKSEVIINGISDASNYQAQAIEQIDQAIEQVSQVVQNNSATSQECAAASMELSNQANRMRSLLSAYTLGNQTNVNATPDFDERNEQIISLEG